ncbi:MurR/RpiR family transcriptional regulator [Proteus cibarius]|uniref:MurR/RpiR family transcriptional regulator n=2 Tax=Proteus terrae TaxID=1574161 RepID=A0A6G6T105_9GAMM|nr:MULTISPECIES: MurR/RpiR family transcriptional regulator [Proteus]QHP78194.1 MurR/RpiR family transcriptional regulator [Proteus vulgaris]MBG2915387.1 MurR/RpiR family transcriptional regulator [Proteus terrae subsp. cibarius]MBG3091985.1 MurR/RpiR family transcriptional regulator [Proteus terrae subsp. cibarius]MBG6038759.1 MurR/RpiR family transcriptional regulator [Proteus terrae subsp. cibarius]MCM2368434.1 MurR/RpiR family transcriptional regulator [Proteus sp. FZP2095]
MLDFLKNYDNLTISEKKVLKYLTDNITDIPYLNINDLVAKTFVSKTVIINLSQKLGFSGFKELKFQINNYILTRNKVEKTNAASYKKQLEKNIHKTFTLINEEQIQECAKTLRHSRNIFIVARGTSKAVGYYLEHLLFALGLHCFFINDYNLSDSFTRLVNEDDTVIFISLSGGTKKIIETAKIVQLKDANIISMTAFNTNELTTYATHALFCFADNHDTKKDDTKSRIGFFMLVDLLINELENLL